MQRRIYLEGEVSPFIINLVPDNVMSKIPWRLARVQLLRRNRLCLPRTSNEATLAEANITLNVTAWSKAEPRTKLPGCFPRHAVCGTRRVAIIAIYVIAL
jgi:hypothetical protein